MRQSRLHAFETRAQFRRVKMTEKKSSNSAHRLVTAGHRLCVSVSRETRVVLKGRELIRIYAEQEPRMNTNEHKSQRSAALDGEVLFVSICVHSWFSILTENG